MDEIAHITDVSVATLERRFADIIKKGYSEAKMSLRRRQMATALGHEAKPAQFLRDESGALIFKEGAPILIKAEEKSVSGNPTMQIWLGKQWLGQRDTPIETPVNLDVERTTYEIEWGGVGENPTPGTDPEKT